MRAFVMLAVLAALSNPCGATEEGSQPPADASAPVDSPMRIDQPADAPDPVVAPTPVVVPAPGDPPPSEPPSRRDPVPPHRPPDTTPTTVTTVSGRPTTRPAYCVDLSGGWPEEYTACKRDADCTTATTSCCGCSAGGPLRVVATKYVPCIVPLEGDCSPTGPCTSSYHCFEDEPVCKQGQCTRVPRAEAPPVPGSGPKRLQAPAPGGSK